MIKSNVFLAVFRKIKIFHYSFPQRSFVFSFLIFIAVFLIIVNVFYSFESPLVLRFNQFQGIVRFGERSELFGIWILFLAIWLVNNILAEFFLLRDKFLSYVLLGVNIFLSFVLFVAIVTILFVN